MRLIQLGNGDERRVAIVEEPYLRLLACASIYELANASIAAGRKLSELARAHATSDTLEYDAVYDGTSAWRILPAIDHPIEPARCLVSGTGLTHTGSAAARQAMHADTADLTDSMKMFRWGAEGGRPAADCIGTSPEWFHKGTGSNVRAHGQPLTIPPYALDGGEEAELAGVYVVAADGTPFRIGMTVGNEFSDHCFEKQNYLYLASSKLRECAIGPELTLDPDYSSVTARVAIERTGKNLWSQEFRTGDAAMCHSLQNIEHHHFKFAAHRRPGDVHVHFFGTDRLSFSDNVRLEDGDIMQIAFEGFGRPLRNPVKVEAKTQEPVRVRSL